LSWLKSQGHNPPRACPRTGATAKWIAALAGANPAPSVDSAADQPLGFLKFTTIGSHTLTGTPPFVAGR